MTEGTRRSVEALVWQMTDTTRTIRQGTLAGREVTTAAPSLLVETTPAGSIREIATSVRFHTTAAAPDHPSGVTDSVVNHTDGGVPVHTTVARLRT